MKAPHNNLRRPPELPLTRDISFVYRLTWLTAALLSVSSVAGLRFGPAGWYDSESPTFPALLAQDWITLVFGLPLLLGSAWLARRGSMRGLLCWMGALFYVTYFYYFYIVGIRFNPLFPVYTALVSMSMYSVFALLFALDLRAVKARFNGHLPVRLTGGFLIAISLAFSALWTGLIVASLAAGAELDPVTDFVVAINGVVLLPLSFLGGIWLWQRLPLGHAVASLLLTKLVVTFLTLLTTTAVTIRWGRDADPLQTIMYAAGLIGALALLVRCLKAVDAPVHDTSSIIERFIGRPDVAESLEILVHAPADIVFDVAQNFDLLSIPMVHSIIRLRERLFRVKSVPRTGPKGLVAESRALGWGVLACRPDRELVMGAVTQPWVSNVKFRAIPSDDFANFSEPGFVKIVWTLEAEPRDPGLTRFRTQTRVLATDDAARKKFRRYWLMFGAGIILIRWFGNRAIRRESERRASGTRWSLRVLESVWGASQIAFHIALGPTLNGWRRRWGADEDEIRKTLAGDEFIPSPDWSYNHAITIAAPRSAVWPWLVQIGQSRGGFYSYEGLENSIRCDIHNVWEIRPELQRLSIGDTIRLHASGYGPPVAILDPERALVLGGPPDANGSGATWSFYLLDGPGDATRLLERGRGKAGRGIAAKLVFGPYLMDPIGFVMSRKMLRSIKRLAEGSRTGTPPASAQHTEKPLRCDEQEEVHVL